MTPRISHCDRVSNPIDMSLWQKREREREVSYRESGYNLRHVALRLMCPILHKPKTHTDPTTFASIATYTSTSTSRSRCTEVLAAAQK